MASSHSQAQPGLSKTDSALATGSRQFAELHRSYTDEPRKSVRFAEDLEVRETYSDDDAEPDPESLPEEHTETRPKPMSTSDLVRMSEWNQTMTHMDSQQGERSDEDESLSDESASDETDDSGLSDGSGGPEAKGVQESNVSQGSASSTGNTNVDPIVKVTSAQQNVKSSQSAAVDCSLPHHIAMQSTMKAAASLPTSKTSAESISLSSPGLQRSSGSPSPVATAVEAVVVGVPVDAGSLQLKPFEMRETSTGANPGAKNFKQNADLLVARAKGFDSKSADMVLRSSPSSPLPRVLAEAESVEPKAKEPSLQTQMQRGHSLSFLPGSSSSSSSSQFPANLSEASGGQRNTRHRHTEPAMNMMRREQQNSQFSQLSHIRQLVRQPGQGLRERSPPQVNKHEIVQEDSRQVRKVNKHEILQDRQRPAQPKPDGSRISTSEPARKEKSQAERRRSAASFMIWRGTDALDTDRPASSSVPQNEVRQGPFATSFATLARYFSQITGSRREELTPQPNEAMRTMRTTINCPEELAKRSKKERSRHKVSTQPHSPQYQGRIIASPTRGRAQDT